MSRATRSHHRQTAETRDNLAQEFEFLATSIDHLDRQTGGVAARMRQTCDQPCADWVPRRREHDRDDRDKITSSAQSLVPLPVGPAKNRTYQSSRTMNAPLHSITSSARASNDGGTVMPSILAVSALMTSSNFDDCTTGRSAGFAPLRTRPT